MGRLKNDVHSILATLGFSFRWIAICPGNLRREETDFFVRGIRYFPCSVKSSTKIERDSAGFAHPITLNPVAVPARSGCVEPTSDYTGASRAFVSRVDMERSGRPRRHRRFAMRISLIQAPFSRSHVWIATVLLAVLMPTWTLSAQSTVEFVDQIGTPANGRKSTVSKSQAGPPPVTDQLMNSH